MKNCPYCNSEVVCEDSEKIYGKSYGYAYICSQFPHCDAYVGCHPGTKRSLGRLANKELRRAKNGAHRMFDEIWKTRLKKTNDKKSRKLAYIWLAEKMGIDVKKCHIGRFDVEQCKRVIEICEPYYKKILISTGAI